MQEVISYEKEIFSGKKQNRTLSTREQQKCSLFFFPKENRTMQENIEKKDI